MGRKRRSDEEDYVIVVGDPKPHDELQTWTRAELIRMDAKFSLRMERELEVRREEKWLLSRKNYGL
jgi:hypothetical protein